MIEHTHKKCSKCAETKSLKHYYKSSNQSGDGRQGQCKECYKAYYMNVGGKDGYYSSDETRVAYGWPKRFTWNMPDKKTCDELNLSRIMRETKWVRR